MSDLVSGRNSNGRKLSERQFQAQLGDEQSDDSGGMVGLTGQSLPILAPLLTIDVLWSDKHMEHESRSLMRYDSSYWTFRTARAPKILDGSGALTPHS